MAAASGDPVAVIDLEDLSFGTPGPHHFEDSPSPTDPFSSQGEQDLSFLHPSDDHGSSDGSDPDHIRYSVDWKVALRKGQRLSWLTHQTEDSTIALPPETYWERTLKAKLAGVLESKASGVHCVPEETNIVLAVKYRSSVRKSFPGQDIQWSVVEDQLQAWSHLLHEGKQLGVKISFIYKVSGDANSTVARQRSRRGATALQRAELDTINAQHIADGDTIPWIDVYYLMRCPGPPCKLGPYCWIDADDGNKHYKLTNSLLSRLIDYTEAGNQFVSHRDVPQTIQDELKGAAQQESRGTKRKASSGDCPITINVLGGFVECGQGAAVDITRLCPETLLAAAGLRRSSRLAVPGLQDEALTRYREWLCQQVQSESWKRGFRQAEVLAMDEGLELSQIYANAEKEADGFVKRGVKRGIALQFVHNISKWLETL